jgi:hypothetical protein
VPDGRPLTASWLQQDFCSLGRSNDAQKDLDLFGAGVGAVGGWSSLRKASCFPNSIPVDAHHT